jgi:hypothetical protein
MNLDMIGLFQGQRKTQMMRAHNCVERRGIGGRVDNGSKLTTRTEGKV